MHLYSTSDLDPMVATEIDKYTSHSLISVAMMATKKGFTG